jgi:DNA-binding PadR family transcriptional regulator
MSWADGDFIVLGFLLWRPMSGYEIKAMMDATVGHFLRPSFGGIYPSLEKLARAKYAAAAQSVSAGKIRKTYRPLPAGRKAFREWLGQPPDVTRGPGAILARVFFIGFAGRAGARRLGRAVREAAGARQAWLKRAAVEIRGVADPYQAATCRFGIDYYGFLQKWFARWEEEL